MVWQQISLSWAEIVQFFKNLDWHDMGDILSPALVSAAVSIVIANALKVLILALKRKRSIKASEIATIARGGGMPSSHAAAVAGLAITVGIMDGFGSSVFAIAFVFAVVVLVDATQVRRAVGEQGATLHAMIDHEPQVAMKPYRSIGHKPSEVVVGVLVGLVCGLLISIAMG